jgi:hypothetical protein
MMIGKVNLKVGQRVRPSEQGIAANLFPDRKAASTGVVKYADYYPTVLWDGRKSGESYHPDFIAIDRRRSITGENNG